MDILIVPTGLMTLILFVLLSINHKLSAIIKDKEKLSANNDSAVEIRDLLTEIKSSLENINHTTDIIEAYKLPTHSERENIDQYRIDQEIDEMLRKKSDK